MNTRIYTTEPCPVCENKDFLQLHKHENHDKPCGLAICKKCGLVQLAHRMSTENYREFYQSGEYNKVCMDDLDEITLFYYEYKLMAGYLIKFFEKIKTELSGLKVYEIGCGSGGILLRLQEQGALVSGCDIDTRRANTGRELYNLSLEAKAAEELTREDLKGYNIILLSNVLEHLHQPLDFLKHLREIIPENARLIVDVPNISNAAIYSPGNGFSPFVRISHIWYFSVKSLKNLMGRAGFKMQTKNVRGPAFTTEWQISQSQDTFESDYKDALKAIKTADSVILRALHLAGVLSKALFDKLYYYYAGIKED